MANAYYDYYISNQDLLQECDKEENMAVTGASVTYCLKRRLYNAVSSVTYSPTHRQDGAPTINIRSTLRTAPDLWKNMSLAVLFFSNGNSYTVSTQSDMCIYTHIFYHLETLVGHKN